VNERIRQLANEAGLQPFEDCGPKYVYKMERFAELIVRECISVVDKLVPPGYQDYPDYKDQVERSFRIECVAEIKKHFGVEE
jgi:hypothetical protein